MKVMELSGGVGGARMARGLTAVPDVDLTVVVNVGDDEEIHGLHVSADLDTVIYTLAGVEGPDGWGRSADTFVLNAFSAWRSRPCVEPVPYPSPCRGQASFRNHR